MNDSLQAYLHGPEPARDSDHTSLYRQALSEALQLSSALVQPLESQIESDYQSAKRQAQERLAADKGRVEAALQAQSQEIQQRHDARVQAIRAHYEEQLSTIKVDAHHGHNRVNQKSAELKTAAEKEHQDQLMVADYVAEGAAARIQQQRIEAQAAAQDARRHLEALGVHANRLLRRYRQPVPPRDEGAESGATTYEHPAESYRAQQTLAEEHLKTLGRLFTAQLFAGARPLLFAGGLLGGAAILLALLYLLKVPHLPGLQVTGPATLGLVAVLVGLGGRALWQRAKRQVQREFSAFQEALTEARTAFDQQYQLTLQDLEQQTRASLEQKETELRKAREALEAAKIRIVKQRSTTLQEIDERQRKALGHLQQHRDEAMHEAQREYREQQSALEHRSQEDLARIQATYDQETTAGENEYRTSRRQLEERWDRGRACIEAMLQDTTGFEESARVGWDDLSAVSWTPPATSPTAIRFGALGLDLRTLADTVLARAGSGLQAARPVAVGALLEFPRRCSMLLQAPREGRQQTIETLRAVMLRLFTSFPPGRVRFTILDPVGLGESFAGFMHAGDYLEALVGGRIWTEAAQIQQQLEDLTQHMENVIQKYLRNEFETIEQYNQQAGELAEPYHFLVIADFPAHFSEEAARRLSSIIHSGPRCGVHTLIAYDTRHELPSGIDIEDVSAGSIHLVYENGRYVWQDPVLRQFPLVLERPPEEATVTKIMHVIGKAGAKAARVEVPFEAVAPTPPQYWSLDSREELTVPLGRTGATRLQNLRLGRGVAQHMLIAGKTGSGKSTLLHVMVTNLALWYAPDQVELYLIDFKQGVEFKTYVTHHLPHARAIAIESDREFGLSILQRLDAEMTQRGERFRQAGVQDINAYRQATGKTMPRTVLIVDEFQAFFGEDDKLAQDAAVLLEQLVRQGRAFGIHVVLGSQTLGGVFGLARSTMGQMAVRIALQCSEADSQLILDDENSAARLLSRPGEAIYNDVGGRVAGNSPFQTAWLSDSCRDACLGRVTELARDRQEAHEPPVVFEGGVPADITENRPLAACLENRSRLSVAGSLSEEQGTENREPTTDDRLPTTLHVWLGAPVTMKDPTAVVLRRQSGANVLIVGQREEVALHLMTAALVGLAAQLPRRSLQFVILDGTPPDAPRAGAFARVTSVLPHTCRLVPRRSVPEVIAELAEEVEKRVQANQEEGSRSSVAGSQPEERGRENRKPATDYRLPTTILMIYGLQQYRVLRRSEDAFGLSLDDQAEPRPEAQFAELLREGPSVGIHILAWADTLRTLERAVDRQTLREFDHRVLLQMSAADSSNLVDSPSANQLGLHRALLYSEEQGGLEKFRPYDALRDEWLAHVHQKLIR